MGAIFSFHKCEQTCQPGLCFLGWILRWFQWASSPPTRFPVRLSENYVSAYSTRSHFLTKGILSLMAPKVRWEGLVRPTASHQSCQTGESLTDSIDDECVQWEVNHFIINRGCKKWTNLAGSMIIFPDVEFSGICDLVLHSLLLETWCSVLHHSCLEMGGNQCVCKGMFSIWSYTMWRDFRNPGQCFMGWMELLLCNACYLFRLVKLINLSINQSFNPHSWVWIWWLLCFCRETMIRLLCKQV